MNENTCGICYEEYFGNRILVYLNCGHTMCNECHQKLTNNNEIQCPFCRNFTKINKNTDEILFMENANYEDSTLINHSEGNDDADYCRILSLCIWSLIGVTILMSFIFMVFLPIFLPLIFS